MTKYDYTAQINGCDVWENNMCELVISVDERRCIEEKVFDTEDEGVAFLKSITPEMVVEWEQRSKRDGIEVVLFADEITDGGSYDDFHIVGSAEWIGTQLNGIWVNDERID